MIASTELNICAPSIIQNIIQVVINVLWQASFNGFNLSLPYAMVINMVPKTPNPAASVGVAIPKNIVPNVANIKIKTGIESFKTNAISCSFFLSSFFGIAGAKFG